MISSDTKICRNFRILLENFAPLPSVWYLFFYLFFLFLPVVILKKKYTADIACNLQLHLHVYNVIEIMYNARRSSSHGMYTFKLSSKIKSYIRMYILFLRIFWLYLKLYLRVLCICLLYVSLSQKLLHTSNGVHFVVTHLYRCGRNMNKKNWLCCFAWFEYINKFRTLYIPASTGKYIIIKTIFKTIKVIDIFITDAISYVTSQNFTIRPCPINLFVSLIYSINKNRHWSSTDHLFWQHTGKKKRLNTNR